MNDLKRIADSLEYIAKLLKICIDHDTDYAEDDDHPAGAIKIRLTEGSKNINTYEQNC